MTNCFSTLFFLHYFWNAGCGLWIIFRSPCYPQNIQNMLMALRRCAKSNMILMYSRRFLPFEWSLILSWDCTLLMSKRIGNVLFKLLKYLVREEEKMRGRDQSWKSWQGVLRGKWVQLPRICWLHFGDGFEFGLVGVFFLFPWVLLLREEK